MLVELTEFVPAIRMRIVRKVLLGLENRAGCIFHFFSMLLNGAYASKFETILFKPVHSLIFYPGKLSGPG
jgi:hypothetical protein